MEKIVKKMSSLALIMLAVTIFGVYSYGIEESSMMTSSGLVSRNENWLGSKKSR